MMMMNFLSHHNKFFYNIFEKILGDIFNKIHDIMRSPFVSDFFKTHLFINMKISIIAGARYLKKALLFAKIPIVIVDIIFSLPRCCAAIFFSYKKGK